jgi:hypothetical protein
LYALFFPLNDDATTSENAVIPSGSAMSSVSNAVTAADAVGFSIRKYLSILEGGEVRGRAASTVSAPVLAPLFSLVFAERHDQAPQASVALINRREGPLQPTKRRPGGIDRRAPDWAERLLREVHGEYEPAVERFVSKRRDDSGYHLFEFRPGFQ